MSDRWRRDHDHDRGGRRDTTTTAGTAPPAEPSGSAGAVPRPTSTRGLGVLVEDFILYNLVYDSLLNIDLEGNFQPKVATDWSVVRRWTDLDPEHPRRHHFHDGTPLTADDVVYSLTLYPGHARLSIPAPYLTPFTTIEAVDATTVTLTSEAPVAAFDYRMPGMFILPRHIWEAAKIPSPSPTMR